MTSKTCDLTIPSVLADPMISALMVADGVRRQDLEVLLHEKAVALRAAKTSRAAPFLQARRGPNGLPGVCFA